MSTSSVGKPLALTSPSGAQVAVSFRCHEGLSLISFPHRLYRIKARVLKRFTEWEDHICDHMAPIAKDSTVPFPPQCIRDVVDGMLQLCDVLTSQGIKLVFVADGAAPPAKARTLQQRKEYACSVIVLTCHCFILLMLSVNAGSEKRQCRMPKHCGTQGIGQKVHTRVDSMAVFASLTVLRGF